ncbi:MAG TPA: FAD-binding oxidoreductase [Vicinamibacterales bacterium]|nr:FAD-binding oxidoreductase [Vicinamibacterales bacterium]
MSLSNAVAELTKVFAGNLVEPHGVSYHDVRRVHNGYIDKKPALVAQCRGTADIADAVKLARAQKLEIAVKGGGHNVAGRATCEGGVMIDLSLLRQVNVDPQKKIAWAGGGSLWRDFNRETQQFGLATTGGVISSTGVAGLTLGGGFGWLMPRFGMALDNLRSATLVLADGSVETVSATHKPDLFWAIRGGGGNFGIAAVLEFQLHDVGPMVTGGLVAHPAPKAKDVLSFFRERTHHLPDEAFLVCAMAYAPDGSGNRIAAIAAQHSGPLASGEAFVKPIKAFGPPVMDMMGPMPYVASNMMLDDAFQKGARNYWKSHFLNELPDGAIDALIDGFNALPTPQCQIAVEHFHGAATRVPVGDTAYAMRDSGYNILLAGQWLDPADDKRCIDWCKAVYDSLTPFMSTRRYVNYLNEDELRDAGNLATVYGPNVARLRQIKKQYDPENVFHLNLNIPPA